MKRTIDINQNLQNFYFNSHALWLMLWPFLALSTILVLRLVFSLGYSLLTGTIVFIRVFLMLALLGMLLKLILTELQKFQKQISKTIVKSETQIPRWTGKFLDEELSAILLDYRISWYGKKKLTRWTILKVWLKTNYYVFYEIWFYRFINKISTLIIEL